MKYGTNQKGSLHSLMLPLYIEEGTNSSVPVEKTSDGEYIIRLSFKLNVNYTGLKVLEYNKSTELFEINEINLEDIDVRNDILSLKFKNLTWFIIIRVEDYWQP